MADSACDRSWILARPETAYQKANGAIGLSLTSMVTKLLTNTT